MVTDPACLFCKIVAGQVPAQIVYQDDKVVAFRDVRPVAPTHVLVVPRAHFAGLNDAEPEHHAVLGHALATTAKLAAELGVDQAGYRTVINTGTRAGQSVFHLHVHLLGGRDFGWPPG
jgi:histidine triad (HIT) family protein